MKAQYGPLKFNLEGDHLFCNGVRIIKIVEKYGIENGRLTETPQKHLCQWFSVQPPGKTPILPNINEFNGPDHWSREDLFDRLCRMVYREFLSTPWAPILLGSGVQLEQEANQEEPNEHSKD